MISLQPENVKKLVNYAPTYANSNQHSARSDLVNWITDVNGRNEKRQQIETDQDSEDVKDRDNRALVDDNKAQTLSSDDIDRMKRFFFAIYLPF